MVDWDSVIIGLIPGIIAAVISGVFAYTREMKIKRLEFENEQKIKNLETELHLSTEYDIKLRENRVVAYSKLWTLLEPLAKYARPQPVTNKSTLYLWKGCREWYFKIGGLFLTENARTTYFLFMDEIQEVLEEAIEDPDQYEDIAFMPYKKLKDKVQAKVQDNELPKPTLQRLIDRGHDLRTTLVEDIGTRIPPKLKFAAEKSQTDVKSHNT
jgi:hypothetical protein